MRPGAAGRSAHLCVNRREALQSCIVLYLTRRVVTNNTKLENKFEYFRYKALCTVLWMPVACRRFCSADRCLRSLGKDRLSLRRPTPTATSYVFGAPAMLDAGRSVRFLLPFEPRAPGRGSKRPLSCPQSSAASLLLKGGPAVRVS
ncbi:hypothetical protein NDU88_001305 [Pleurodeles waltl]|uniref:Uncharacterized protein n=1 Tax=Pleurodeles waltl TaxID=8319 RepID=A0AAV7S874_PLEWA|nr:hypothetical protein NDU88_001305 [Pleurodeles waltl]